MERHSFPLAEGGRPASDEQSADRSNEVVRGSPGELTFTSKAEDDDSARQIKQYRFGDFKGYMASKRQKLKEQERELGSQPFPSEKPVKPLFSGLCIHVSPSCHQHSELRLMITRGGGDFEHYLSKKSVDFVIVPSLTNAKLHEFRNFKVVTPDFIIDSVRDGRLAPWTRYRVTGMSESQGTLSFGKASIRSEGSVVRSGPTSQAAVEGSALSLVTEAAELSAEDAGIEDGGESPIFEEEYATFEIGERRPTNSPSSRFRGDARGNSSSRERSEWALKQTATAPDFLTKFYQQSRLHWLSTWKAELRDMVARLNEERELLPKEKRWPRAHDIFHKRRAESRQRVIMHVDMDCFFPSVAIRDRPELADKPVAVCHTQASVEDSSAEIASCNYVARSYGLRNGMFLGSARQKCPNLVTVPYEFEKYKECTAHIYKILLHHADELQAVSCDEALLDVSSKVAEPGQGQEEALAQQIRQEIREATRCEASIGISGNIMLARMATKQAKPCGQYFLKSDEVQGFLRGKSVRELPGVGWSLEQRLMDKGIILISDLQQKSKSELQKSFGPKTGKTLYEFSRGVDERPLAVATPRQSIGADVTWGVRFDDNKQVEKFVNDLAAEVARRMKAVGGGEGIRARCITFKIKMRAANAPKEPPKFLGCGECDSYSKSVKLVHATDDAEVISRECNIMMRQFNFDPMDIRGLGIQMTKFEKMRENASQVRERKLRIAGAVPSQNSPFLSQRLQGTLLSAKASDQGTSPKSDHNSSDAEGQSAQQPPEQISKEAAKPTLVIDRIQFLEYPEGIRKDLAEQHNLVFTSIDASGSSSDAPRTSLAAATSPTPKIRGQSSSSIRIRQGDGLPAWDEIDPAFLSALPDHELRDTLEAYAKRRHAEISAADDQRGSTSAPAWSQLDPAFLLALPHDEIKTTIEMYICRKNNSPPDQPNKRSDAVTETRIDPSIEILPSSSQLDMEVLAALPPSLRKQIEIAYKRNAEATLKSARPPASQQSPKDKVAGGSAAKSTRSPSKLQKGSPSKRNAVKRERGFATLTQWSKGQKQPTTEALAKEGATQEQDVAEWTNSQGETIDKDVLDALPNDVREEVLREFRRKASRRQQQHQQALPPPRMKPLVPAGGSAPDNANDVGSSAPEPPTLIGARTPEDVREVLHEWMSTSNNEDQETGSLADDRPPFAEDVDAVAEYAVRCIEAKDLEMARMVLSSLMLASEEMSYRWKSAFEVIYDRVQNAVNERYGRRLKLL